MGRVSKEQMERNRDNIIKTSAQLFRERGLDGVSVNDIMTAVGLTHGGFYGHFGSKDQLEALACERAFADTRAAVDAGGFKSFEQFVSDYLSPEHRDSAGSGCAVTALGSDVLRKEPNKPVRKAYTSGVREMLDRLAALQGDDANDPPCDRYLAQLAMLTGALVMARATRGDDISERFLTAAARQLLTPRPDE